MPLVDPVLPSSHFSTHPRLLLPRSNLMCPESPSLWKLMGEVELNCPLGHMWVSQRVMLASVLKKGLQESDGREGNEWAL